MIPTLTARIFAVAVLLAFLAALPRDAFSQGSVNVTATEVTTGARAQIGDTDDGSIAGGNIGVINLSFSMLWDGSAWRRSPMYAEDSPHVSGDSVTMMGCVQQTGTAALAGDGDRTIPQCDVNGWLKVGGLVTVEPGGSPLVVTINDSADLDVNVLNGSATVTEDGDIPASTTSVAQTAAVQYGSNGSSRIALFADPCETEARTPFTISTTANVQFITGTASERVFICDLKIMTATAQNINIVSGTGTVCATGITAVGGISGGTTAATGWNFGANGGLVAGAGANWIARVANLADNVCLLTSSTGQITGGGSYVSQP